MAKYRPGSNREIISDALTKHPQTAQDLSTITGISLEATESVLIQIRPHGVSVSKKDKQTGLTGWTLGNGKPAKTKKAPVKGVRKMIMQHLSENVGNIISIQGIVTALKLFSEGYPSAILKELEAEGKLTRANSVMPHTWTINASINDPEQAKLLPPPPRGFNTRPQDMPQQPPQAFIPDPNAVMQTSAAISHLMQSEQRSIMNQQTLQQILVIYEQLGNILEMAGLIED